MRYTIFGESHGPAIGVVLQDVPPGLTVDLEAMAFELGRRAPGKSPMATARKEADQVEFLSGLFQGCLLYTSPSPRDKRQSRMPSSA